MSFIRNLLALALALAMAGAGVLFALQNADPVPLDILIMSLPPRSIALWVLGALALGGILGMAFSSLAIFRLRTRLSAARRQVSNAQTELDRLRASSLTRRE